MDTQPTSHQGVPIMGKWVVGRGNFHGLPMMTLLNQWGANGERTPSMV